MTFWNAYNSVTETPVMNGIVIPAFEAAHPGIKVVDDTLPYNGMLQKFIAASAAGHPPSLMRSDIAWVPQLASEGVLLKTSAQPWFAKMKKAAFPGPLSTNFYKGSYYGIPLDTNTQVLFWNKADFAAAGLTPPTTYAQLISDAQTLTVPSKGQHGLGVDSTDIWNVGPLVWPTGANFTNKSWTKATGYMDSSTMIAAVQELVTLDTTGVIGSDMVGGSGAISGETGFPTGQYAMYLDGPWATNTYKQANFTGYGTVIDPPGPGGSGSVVGGEDLVIAKHAPNMAATIKFVKFLQSPFSQLAMVAAGQMTAYKTYAASEIKVNPALAIFAKQLLTARARPVTQGYAALDTAFSNELQLMLAGKITVTAGLQAAAQAANAALK
ncbi:MAG TPA: extracellular solute-binding protein [Acidimicrobiales bacterium]|nr:extracellular solute-binding protein [Acidimicrobiales bacterium]